MTSYNMRILSSYLQQDRNRKMQFLLKFTSNQGIQHNGVIFEEFI